VSPDELVADSIRARALRRVAEEFSIVSPCDQLLRPAEDPDTGVTGQIGERPDDRIGGRLRDHLPDVVVEKPGHPVIFFSGTLQRGSVRVSPKNGRQANLVVLPPPHVVRNAVENLRAVAKEFVEDNIGKDKVIRERPDVREDLPQILF
jgi:hypothetical protein